MTDRELADRARLGRWLTFSTVAASGAGHIGGPLSAMELWVALFFRVLAIRPDEREEVTAVGVRIGVTSDAVYVTGSF